MLLYVHLRHVDVVRNINQDQWIHFHRVKDVDKYFVQLFQVNQLLMNDLAVGTLAVGSLKSNISYLDTRFEWSFHIYSP